MTVAPRATAIWVATTPTLPDAPLMTRTFPAVSSPSPNPIRASARYAVVAATGSAPATSHVSSVGFAASAATSARAFSA